MELIDYIKSLPIRRFTKNELVFANGDPSETFLAIREGFIKVTTTEDSGRQRLLWIAGRYDLVPLERFFVRKSLQYDYVGYTDGSAYIIDKTRLHELTRIDPNVTLEIAKGLSEHFDDVSERLSAVGKSDVRSKLLYTLFNIATKFSPNDVVKLHELGLVLTQQDIADMIGASREIVSIELGKGRNEEFVDYSRTRLTINTRAIRKHLNILA